MITFNRTCKLETCGELFETTRPKQQFCNPECQRIFNNRTDQQTADGKNSVITQFNASWLSRPLV